MRVGAPISALIAAVVITATACTDNSSTAPAEDDLPVAAAVTGACDAVRDVTQSARSYFSQPERRDVQDLARDLGTACDAGLQNATKAVAWQIMGIIEDVIGADRAGDPVVGSSLVNALLACTVSLCEKAAQPGINFAGPLVGAGLFAVRSAGTTPALAGAVVPFTDEEGKANTALWGVSVDTDWKVVTGADPVLVYGMPLQPKASPELNVGHLRYELNVFPDAGEFVDGALHVGVCFASSFELPTVAGADPGALMRRNNVVLEDYQPTFCPPAAAPQSASIFGPIFSMARRVLPSRFVSMRRATKVGVIGGTPLDFSEFSPVAANTAATLEFVTEPNPVVTVGQSIGNLRVRARTGDGTPMEKVLVTLTILNNSGSPAGAVLSGDVASITAERNGEEGIAVFPDDGPPVTVGKAGGYRICASGQLSPFTFTQVCSAVFNARNAN